MDSTHTSHCRTDGQVVHSLSGAPSSCSRRLQVQIAALKSLSCMLELNRSCGEYPRATRRFGPERERLRAGAVHGSQGATAPHKVHRAAPAHEV